jgi:succinate dehydrogenase (ubiquinone) cytochrome b560 subunit
MFVCNNSPSGRPISPHVTIYKFPVPALTSITFRATGVALTAGITGAAAMGMLGADVPAMWDSLKVGAPALVPVAKMLVAFPLVYHFVGGLRHLYWDATAKMLDIQSVDQLSYAMVGVSVVLTLLLAFTTI